MDWVANRKRRRVGGVILSIDTAVVLFEIEDACPDEIFLSLADLALSVKVPDRFRQCLNDVRPFRLKDIEDMMSRDDVGFPTFERFVKTKKTYDIRRIGVETLSRDGFQLDIYAVVLLNKMLVVGRLSSPRVGPVKADFVPLLCVLTEVYDMTQEMPFAVLRHNVSKVGTKTHKGHSGLIHSPFVHGKALEQYETSTINELITDPLEIGSHFVQGKLLLFNIESVLRSLIFIPH